MNSNNRFISYIILFFGFFLGGFFFWAIKGFKTSIKSEFEDKKIRRNIFVALIIFALYYIIGQSKYFEPKRVITEPAKFNIKWGRNGKNFILTKENGDTLLESKDTVTPLENTRTIF
jgi:hypothetical protein